MRKGSVIAIPYLIFAAIFTLIPLVLILYYSFRTEIFLDNTDPITLPALSVVLINDEAVTLESDTTATLTGLLTAELADGRSVEIPSGTMIDTTEQGSLELIALNNQNGGVRFSGDNFAKFFNLKDRMYIKVLINSLYMALLCTVICLALGFPLAYLMTKFKPFWRNLFSFLLVLPMWMNFLIRTYAWRPILADNGLIHSILSSLGLPTPQLMPSQGAVALGLVYNLLPFMVLPIFNMLLKLDGGLLEASYDLGANRVKTFMRVVLPLSLPGVVSGVIMTFMPAMTTFTVSKILGGGQTMLIGDLIEREFKTSGNWGFGSAISLILMVLMLFTMGFLARVEREQSESGVLL